MRFEFNGPVVSYMTREIEIARVDTPIQQIALTLHRRGISGIPIVDSSGDLVGVVTRTDLIAVGLLRATQRRIDRVMSLPSQRASEVMTHAPITVTSSSALRHAARVMIEHDIHRVFVTEGHKLAGVLCAVDLAAAVRDARVDSHVSSIMSRPILDVDVHTPLDKAIELLDRIHITGLIVTDDGLPIGTFTQLDALASRDLPRSTPIEDVYDAAVICLPTEMKIHRVAAHVADLQVRRVVVCEAREAVGVVSATDFARLVAMA